MRHTMTIFKWEMRKIISNWRRTLVVFLMPAVLLLVALNVFPLLINYLSTGHLQSHPIIAINAPDSFQEYAAQSAKSTYYDYTFYSSKEYKNKLEEDEEYFLNQQKKGVLLIRFSAKDEDGKSADFDTCVERYYGHIARYEQLEKLKCNIVVSFDSGSFTNYTQAEQFLLNIKKEYKDYLFSVLGEEYAEAGGGYRWDTDGFNPFTFVMRNRANANLGAARTIPGVMVLLMYYCVYSLVGEILASSRESGFLTKVYLTPIPEVSLLTGKMLTVVTVSSISAMLSYLLLFFSSWLNHSNSAFSLLPFGMFLTPTQLLILLITILVTSFLMCGLCFGIVFKIRRMEDVLLNLQIPLVLLVFEFFGQMFRPSQSLQLEFMIPIHNAIMMIRDVFLGRFQLQNFVLTVLINGLLTVILIALCIKNTDGMIHISQGGPDDTGRSRK
ncbi:MAG: ABC transporter permease [Clostridiales bacterium]|nr:ABC transporter permease [Clostridiales bacterium]